jgi:hypothetical protein
MKHARPDYDRIQDPAGLIPADEPVFLIRGQDIIGPAAVDALADLAEYRGAAAHIVEAAREQARRMREWGFSRGAKVPDMPAPTDNSTRGG